MQYVAKSCAYIHASNVSGVGEFSEKNNERIYDRSAQQQSMRFPCL